MHFLVGGVVVLLAVASRASALPITKLASNHSRMAELGAYVVDPNHVYVAGLSAGAYMATQLAVAYSSLFRGHGSLAGGPYYCAENNLNTGLGPCMATPQLINVNNLVEVAREYEASGQIDALSNLDHHRSWIYHGTNDGTVAEGCARAHEDFMLEFSPASQIETSYGLEGGHAHPTDDFGNACTSTRSPWINDCNYDGTGIMLRWLYSPTTIRARVPQIPANLFEFDQTGEFASVPFILLSAPPLSPSSSFLTLLPAKPSTSDVGFVYVPTNCQNGATCSLVVSLHGCQQYHDSLSIGDVYVTESGYNEYAEANDIIVLYPQTVSSITPYNPNGCWDWWGYASANYGFILPSLHLRLATKNGPQMDAIYQMVRRLMSGAPPIDAPAAPSVVAIGDNTVNLTWTAVDGADSYDVLRNGSRANDSPIPTAAYQDTGLQSGTTYAYAVVARNNQGGSSSPSPATHVTTTGTPPPLQAPTNVAVTGATATTISLQWSVVAGAVYYGIYRDAAYAGNVTTTTFTDTGLAPETTYTYTLYASNSENQLSPESDPVDGRTTSSWQCVEYFDSNYDHERAGRAYQRGGICYAVGSDDYMGLWNVGAMTNLAETSENYYIVGEC